jgi:putative ABC transport system permease protein
MRWEASTRSLSSPRPYPSPCSPTSSARFSTPDRWYCARPAQAVTMVLVVAGIVTALLLSATLLEGTTDPWRALFARTNGAEVWLRLSPGTRISPLARMDGVTQVGGPYQATAAALVRGPLTAPVQLWAMRPTPPAVGSPIMRQGRWLMSSRPTGVVLEASFAQAIRARIGSTVVMDGLDGSSVRAIVLGVAYTSDQGFYPQQTPGLIWALPGLVHQVEPVRRHTAEVVGLRLADPSASGFAVQQAVTQLGSDAVLSVATWRDVERSMDGLCGALLAIGSATSPKSASKRPSNGSPRRGWPRADPDPGPGHAQDAGIHASAARG